MHPDTLVLDPAVARLSDRYESPYEAVIKPQIVMGVTRYFIERWVPVLGTGPATVVNTLRQLTYRDPDQPITITGEALAREAAMSRRHLYSCLKAPWLGAFVVLDSGQRVRAASGRVVQETNRYHVRGDDPLAPSDAAHLLHTLPTLGTKPLEAVQAALALPPRDLWARAVTPPAELPFPAGTAITAQMVLERAFPGWRPADTVERQAFKQAAIALHQHITLVDNQGRAKKIIVPQYFRQHWWPLLGHDLAWSYLWLRGEVYENRSTDVARYSCWVASLDVLLTLLNRPYEWWRRNVEKAPARGVWSLNDFFVQTAKKKGLDPAAPQLVARQFAVALDLPIAPEDRGRYSALLIEWPDTALESDSEPERLIEDEDDPLDLDTDLDEEDWSIEELLALAGADRLDLPEDVDLALSLAKELLVRPSHTQNDTLEIPPSHTFEHTETPGVPDICAQSSLTFVHSDSESFISTIAENPVPPSSSKYRTKQPPSRSAKPAAAAKGIPSQPILKSSSALIDVLVDGLQQTPERSLTDIFEVSLWLQQAWPEPIQPHTPAWTIATSGELSARELVALMMAVWADTSIQHPPRYLSWLLQRWRTQPQTEPVTKWAEWLALADLPLGQWPSEGRRLWAGLVAPGHVTLPFGLEIAISEMEMEALDEHHEERASAGGVGEGETRPEPDQKSLPPGTGLDERPGPGAFTIQDIWQVALGQLSLLVGRATYTNWIEGARAVSFEDGVLTVRARHYMARELLSKRLNKTIEETVSALAQVPITIRYIL